jgi:N-ethylmaleimide reductase
MNATKTSQLFSPVELGSTRLKHRVVMAPLTRSRSVQPDGVPGDLMLEYYTRNGPRKAGPDCGPWRGISC